MSTRYAAAVGSEFQIRALPEGGYVVSLVPAYNVNMDRPTGGGDRFAGELEQCLAYVSDNILKVGDR